MHTHPVSVMHAKEAITAALTAKGLVARLISNVAVDIQNAALVRGFKLGEKA